MTISSDERERLRGLVVAAAEGPWDVEGREVYTGNCETVAMATQHEDAAFIAAARTAVPALLDALEEAERDAKEWRATARSIAIRLGERDHTHSAGTLQGRCHDRLDKMAADLAAARAEVTRWKSYAEKVDVALTDRIVELSEANAALRGLAEREAGR
jgi:ABC-type nitrate/sulfonate/bicarbonate transport system substrate-binding protein